MTVLDDAAFTSKLFFSVKPIIFYLNLMRLLTWSPYSHHHIKD